MSKDNEVVSEPSSSRSNPLLHVKPKVTLNPTPHANTKRTRNSWPKWVKEAIRQELGDCIQQITKLPRERAKKFLEKHDLQERGFMNLKNVIYNMGRRPR